MESWKYREARHRARLSHFQMAGNAVPHTFCHDHRHHHRKQAAVLMSVPSPFGYSCFDCLALSSLGANNREYYARLKTFVTALGDLGGGVDAMAFVVSENAAEGGTAVSRGQKQQDTSLDSRRQKQSVPSTSVPQEAAGRGVQHNAELEMKPISRGGDSRSWERSESGSTLGNEGGGEAVADPAAVVSDSRQSENADRFRGQGKRESGGHIDLGSMPLARGKHPTVSTVASGDSSSIFASTGVAAPSPEQRASALAMAV